MTNYIRRHAVAIWQEGPGGQFIGSGSCIQIADHLFIATAAHNFFDIPNGGTISLFSTSSNTPLTFTAQDYGHYGAPDTLDLAWLEIDRDSAAECGLEGLPLEGIRAYHTQQNGDIYQITGFPAERAKPRVINNHPDITVPLVIYNTISGRNSNSTSDDLLTSYGRIGITDNGLEEMPHPGGISGGGVWYIPPVDISQVWSPMQHPLVGVVTHYLPISGQIRGLRIYHWLGLLLSNHSELSQHIEPLLNQST